jgi:hypothetical protein
MGAERGAFFAQPTFNNVDVIFDKRSQGVPVLCGYLAGVAERKFGAARELDLGRPL